MSEKKLVPQGVFLTCDKGTFPTPMSVTLPFAGLYGFPVATEADKIPFRNIKPFGICSCLTKTFPIPCMPVPLMWENVQEGVTHSGFRLLKEDSTIRCAFGGEISIKFTMQAVFGKLADSVGKLHTSITEEFDDYFKDKEAYRAERDENLSGFKQTLAHTTDWLTDLKDATAEGVVNGAVGTVETVLRIAEDPIGTTEQVVGFVKKGAIAYMNARNEALMWAIDGDNWVKAADSAWNWAKDDDNWKEAANSAWEGTTSAAKWVADNPRDIGNVQGEIVLDVGAGVLSGGATAAGSGARIFGKPFFKTLFRKGGDDLAETVVRNTDNALNKVDDVGEGLAKSSDNAARHIDEAGEVPEVVVKGKSDVFDFTEYKMVDGDRLGDFGEEVIEDMLSKDGYEFYYVQNRSGNGVDIIGKKPNGDMIVVEVKTSRTPKNWNDGNPRKLPLKGDQKKGGEFFSDSRLERAARGDDGYTDDISPQEARRAIDDLDEAIENGNKIEYVKYDVYVNDAGELRGNPVKREWSKPD